MLEELHLSFPHWVAGASIVGTSLIVSKAYDHGARLEVDLLTLNPVIIWDANNTGSVTTLAPSSLTLSNSI